MKVEVKIKRRAIVSGAFLVLCVITTLACQYSNNGISYLFGALAVVSFLMFMVIGIWTLMDYLQVDYHSSY